MKRRFFAAVLALCLALPLLPTRASATASDSTEYWIEMSAEEARAMLNAVANKSETRDMVFIYYDSSITIVESAIRPYINNVGYYIYAYCTNNSGDLLDALAPLFDGNTNLTLPVAVTWNISTQTCMVKENVREVNDNILTGFNGLLTLMEANGLAHGSSAPGTTPSTPPTPSDPDDPATPPDTSGVSSIAGVSEQAWEVLRLLNIYRMEQGLQPLSTFAEVQEAANIRALELFTYCSHTRPDGSDYSTVFPEVGLQLSRDITSWAENIASGQKDAADVMNSWKASPGHNANMLKPSGRVHVGIGYNYQTNGTPSLYASNWVQNFAAAYDCRFSNLQLSRSSIEGKPGTPLETLLKEAGIEVTANCYRHGKSSLPLIAAMCSGYDPNSTSTQELTVTYGGQTATLTVAGDHLHNWDAGTTTAAATCTEPGSISYTCTECGAVKTETIPAAGHNFAANENNETVCQNGCETAVPADVPQLYTALLDVPDSMEAAESSEIEAALESYYENSVFGDPACGYTSDILDGQFIEYRSMYQYRVGIRETQSPLARISYGGTDYILITEPLVVYLDPGDAAPGDDPTAVTPDGNISAGETPSPSEPQPPSKPSNPSFPAGPSGSQPSSRPSGGTGSPSASVYHISVPRPVGGQLVLNPDSAPQGQRVTVTVQPDSGYALDTLRAVDASGNEVELRDLGNGTYEFTMPASAVSFTAAFKKVPAEPALNPAPMAFADVPAGSWFYSSVDYVWKHYLMSGVSDTSFYPEGTTSRAMVWTILARMHGASIDTPSGAAWYEQGRQWAVQQGVSDGTNPASDITREQAAAMLWRDAGSPAVTEALSSFGDSGLVSSYARTAICWAVENGIMQGAGGMLNPQNTASRAEMAVMITRYAAQID